jgi:hypothetical protein
MRIEVQSVTFDDGSTWNARGVASGRQNGKLRKAQNAK